MARALGRTLEELATSMSAQEYGLWWTQYGMEPWGEDRMDEGFGVVASTLANVNRKAGSPPFEVSDFTPYLNRAEKAAPEPEASPLQFIQRLEQKRG